MRWEVEEPCLRRAPNLADAVKANKNRHLSPLSGATVTSSAIASLFVSVSLPP